MYQPAGMIVVLLLAGLAACGAGDRHEEREVMKPEETVVGGLVTAPDRAAQRTDAAVDVHREALDSRLREDEGDSRERE
jgi:hypothetical protein